MGIAIAKGILKTLGIDFIELKPIEPATTAADKIYRVQVGAFRNLDNAKALVTDLTRLGYSAIIV